MLLLLVVFSSSLLAVLVVVEVDLKLVVRRRLPVVAGSTDDLISRQAMASPPK